MLLNVSVENYKPFNRKEELSLISSSKIHKNADHKTKGYISKMVNSRNRINKKIIFLHVNNTEEICNLMHSLILMNLYRETC